MNIIFFIIFVVGTIILTIINPTNVLPTMLSGGEKAISLCLSITPIYIFWMGIFNVFEQTSLSKKLALLLKKPIKFLFGNITQKENELLSINISANLLGMSGIATPSGIEATTSFDKNNNNFAKSMLFVLSATSLQLLPTSVISLKTKLLSSSPFDILLPTILTTISSTVIGIILVKIFVKK